MNQFAYTSGEERQIMLSGVGSDLPTAKCTYEYIYIYILSIVIRCSHTIKSESLVIMIMQIEMYKFDYAVINAEMVPIVCPGDWVLANVF